MYYPLRTVKARKGACILQSAVLNIISCTHTPHLPYTLYREGQAIKKPFAGALSDPMKASLEQASSIIQAYEGH